MASLNKVQIIGRMGRPPEIRYLPSGDAIANVAVATEYKPKDKEKITEWHRVSAFGRLAEIFRDYTDKGSLVYIEGRLQTRKYQKDGVDHYATDIIAEQMQMLGDRQPSEEASSQQQQRPMSKQAPRPAAKPTPHFEDDQEIPF